jgi:hypothetical protein
MADVLPRRRARRHRRIDGSADDEAVALVVVGPPPVLHDIRVTLIRCGGHFEGGTVAHWADGAEGRGVLLSGDIVKVGADRKSISVMRSYPNLIPVGPAAIRRVRAALEPFQYDRIYGAWVGHVVQSDARAVVARSLDRYLKAIGE